MTWSSNFSLTQRSGEMAEKAYVAWVPKGKNRIQYNINPDSYFHRGGLLRKMIIYGFDSLPAGFSSKGFGFTGPPGYIVGDLRKKLKTPIEFHIFLNGKKPQISQSATKTKVYLAYDEIRSYIEELKTYKTERNTRSKVATAVFLNKHFPKRFSKPPAKHKSKYEPGGVAHLLRTKGLLPQLSKEDASALGEFYPKFLRSHGDTLGLNKILQSSKEHKNVGEAVYLGNVIRAFEKMLKKPGRKESEWQAFLKNYILLFNTHYSAMIEKKNISLKIDLPDFLMINVYDYVDIYEIKKPATRLLSFDAGRKNYYWSTEISKAIAQVESYIEELQQHADELKGDFLDEGVKLRVMKPRAYIIAGQSTQLKKPQERDYFKMLNCSLKNVEVILYDDFLQNLKNLFKRLNGGVA
jgi:hypothetical protein